MCSIALYQMVTLLVTLGHPKPPKFYIFRCLSYFGSTCRWK